jgi:hypothetical protein
MFCLLTHFLNSFRNEVVGMFHFWKRDSLFYTTTINSVSPSYPDIRQSLSNSIYIFASGNFSTSCWHNGCILLLFVTLHVFFRM